jgi:hypothetical protein
MKLVFCACGKLVKYAAPETRCEDCFAEDFRRLKISRYGRSNQLNINTTVRSNREGCDVPLSAEDRAARRVRGQSR